jgi:molybdopterin/thiamine biosynthesis adenylyltransferase
MFYVMLHCISDSISIFNRLKRGSTASWLDDANIKYWCAFDFDATNYILFLSEEQGNLLNTIMANTTFVATSELREHIPAIADGVLEVTNFTSEELESPLVQQFIIPENSQSITISENTARFSGATWFEEIQKKVIILAGLGGIGSYVCFLLARMQPTAIYLYDDDLVEAVNMSGQLYGNTDINLYKVDAISHMVANYANFFNVFAIKERFVETSEPSDIMICGFDNMAARKTFFERWREHVSLQHINHRSHCLFIDGRLAAEYFQVLCITGDDWKSQDRYAQEYLFVDEEADETVCSYKQTTYMANMIGSVIVNIFTNFVANEVAHAPIRELPFLTTYDGNSMQFKIE